MIDKLDTPDEATQSNDFDVRIASLPKVELHIHLEGAIRLKTLQELARREDTSSILDELLWSSSNFQYNNFSHFADTINTAIGFCFRSAEDYERIAYELFVDLAEQNVRYVEVGFAPRRGLRWGMSFDEMIVAINTAKQRVVNERLIRIGLIVGFGRGHGKLAVEMAKKAADARKDGAVGIDLWGREGAVGPEEVEAFDIAKSAGLGLRAHAGEIKGAPTIWEVIRSLGVSRIAHGIRALEDADLIEYLRSHPITLDVCPTGNLKLGFVESLSVHPIRRLFELGIRVTVNSDDPLFFTTITEEYRALRRHLGFTYDELKRITLYAVDGAFLSDEDRATLRHEIERDFDTFVRKGKN